MEWSIPAIIEGLKEVARTIGQVIIEEYKKKPIQKDLEKLYKNIRYYYKKALELKKCKGSRELAERIKKDDLFFFYVTNEKAEKIVQALEVVSLLSEEKNKKAKQEKLRIVYWILKCLEAAKNICIRASNDITS